MHRNNNDDLNLNISLQAEIMEDNVKIFPSNSIQQQFSKLSEIKQLTNDEELRKLQNEVQSLKKRLNQFRLPHYEYAMLEKCESFTVITKIKIKVLIALATY